MAAWMAGQCAELGLAVQWQQVEDGRANVLATRAGTGGGPTLMFNGHMDTSYSGREPWLAGIPGFQPQGFERDGRIYGLGISNMKGALVAYLAAVRALGDAPLRGDVMIAAVAGEIEKTQQGDAQGAEFRGYAAGSRHLVGARRRRGHVHPRRADRAEARARALRDTVAPALDVRPVHPHRLLVRTARGELDRAHARCARPRARVAADVGGRDELRRRSRRRERGCDPGRLRLARLADAAPDRPLPRPPRPSRRRDGRGAPHGARVRAARWRASRRRST